MRGAAFSGIDGTGPDGLATVKRNVPALAERMCRPVLTVTTSPGTNGLAGRKLPPRPSESDTRRPACRPLREPVTVSLPSLPTGMPRNAICVCGAATRAPGIGYTLTGRVAGARRRSLAQRAARDQHAARPASSAMARPDRSGRYSTSYTAAQPKPCAERMIGPSSLGRSAVVWQSASTNRAPLLSTKLRAAAGESEPRNSVRAFSVRPRQLRFGPQAIADVGVPAGLARHGGAEVAAGS